MGERANLQSRRELLKQFAPQYRQASSAQKRVLLDTDLDPIYWFSAIFRAKHNHNWEAVHFFWLKWPICQTNCLWQHRVARKMTENH